MERDATWSERMRVWVLFAVVLLAPHAVAAADLLQPYAPPGAVVGGAIAGGSVGIVAGAYPPAPPLVVVAPPRVRLVAPRRRPLNYAPPPVYTSPPPLIAAVPIIGPYLVPVPLGPPPATALDAYDHRFDYNQ